jgi:hypothetical protein
MIYCVIPPELKDELFERLVEYYKDNPNVEVIVDRRSGPDRRDERAAPDAGPAPRAHPGDVSAHGRLG